MNRYRLFLAAIFALAASLSAVAAAPALSPSAINAKSAVVLSFDDGRILFAKNPDAVIPPASVVKLVTLYVAYEAIAAGEISKDTVVVPLPSECEPNLPYRSSLMYLRPGMRVTVFDLMRGLAVASGNDAALVLSRAVAGSQDAFAARMNAAVKSLGLDKMTFVEPSGLSERNLVTARELALFSRAYLTRHPEALTELHSLKRFEFPRRDNYPPGARIPAGKSYLMSRNALVEEYPGCDGLKTGYIDQSGYNFAVTARRDGTRLIVVTLGGWGRDSLDGAANRIRDARTLLDWGFAGYATVRPECPEPPRLPLWMSAAGTVVPVPEREISATVKRGLESGVSVRYELPRYVVGPLSKGDVLGSAVIVADGEIVRRIPLVAPADVPKAPLVVRVFHSIALFFVRIFSPAS